MTYNELLTDHRLLLLELFEVSQGVRIDSAKKREDGLLLEHKDIDGLRVELIPMLGVNNDLFQLLAASGFRVNLAITDGRMILKLTPAHVQPEEPHWPDDNDNEPEPDEPPTQLPMRPRYTNR